MRRSKTECARGKQKANRGYETKEPLKTMSCSFRTHRRPFKATAARQRERGRGFLRALRPAARKKSTTRQWAHVKRRESARKYEKAAQQFSPIRKRIVKRQQIFINIIDKFTHAPTALTLGSLMIIPVVSVVISRHRNCRLCSVSWERGRRDGSLCRANRQMAFPNKIIASLVLNFDVAAR